jgi:hypothetical protein
MTGMFSIAISAILSGLVNKVPFFVAKGSAITSYLKGQILLIVRSKPVKAPAIAAVILVWLQMEASGIRVSAGIRNKFSSSPISLQAATGKQRHNHQKSFCGLVISLIVRSTDC